MDQMIAEKGRDAARHLLGTKYKRLGRGPGGIDCVGVVLRSRAAQGLPPIEAPQYSERHPVAAAAEALCRFAVPLEPKEELPGDICLIAPMGMPSHLGIWTGASVIHSSLLMGMVVEVPVTRLGLRRFFRWKE